MLHFLYISAFSTARLLPNEDETQATVQMVNLMQTYNRPKLPIATYVPLLLRHS